MNDYCAIEFKSVFVDAINLFECNALGWLPATFSPYRFSLQLRVCWSDGLWLESASISRLSVDVRVWSFTLAANSSHCIQTDVLHGNTPLDTSFCWRFLVRAFEVAHQAKFSNGIISTRCGIHNYSTIVATVLPATLLHLPR